MTQCAPSDRDPVPPQHNEKHCKYQIPLLINNQSDVFKWVFLAIVVYIIQEMHWLVLTLTLHLPQFIRFLYNVRLLIRKQ